MIDIGAAGKALDLEIEWRLPSHIEKQLSAPENAHFAQYFFDLGNGPIEFLESLRNHSEYLLAPIETVIPFNDQEIKIDRSESLSKINKSTNQVIILTGDGGSGKTALIKELLNATTIPCYVLKAVEFNTSNLVAVFSQFGLYGITDLLRFHEDEDKKIFVIDSAEKLADLTSLDCFIEALSALINAGWKIIFTTRTGYLDDLSFQMIDVYRCPFEIVKLENLTSAELDALASKYSFELPADVRLKNLLSNLFYLREYLNNYAETSTQLNVAKFQEVLWKKKIQNSSYRKDNTHLERENCFLKLAKERSNIGSFLLHGQGCDGKILSLLEADEIIKREPNHSGYFITHDIYEEWALEKLIETEYVSLHSYDSFFSTIGESLAIRRAFRAWLSDKILHPTVDVKHFVEQSFCSPTIPLFWKDEVLVSILLSEYCAEFFQRFGNVLLADGKAFLERIIFLLRTACKEVNSQLYRFLQKANSDIISPEYIFTKAKGKGWQATIQFIYDRLETIRKDELEVILPLLTDWIANNRSGETTRMVGLLSLHFYKKAELNKETTYSREIEAQLLQLVLLSVLELKEELLEITAGLVSNQRTQYEHQPFENLREAVVTNSDDSFAFIVTFPTRTIELIKAAWNEQEEEVGVDHSGTRLLISHNSGRGIKESYGINDRWDYDYLPASALQTPVRLLLKHSFSETVDFILDFTNQAVETYFTTGADTSVKEVDLIVSGKKKRQIISSGLWAMYRGIGAPVTPYLLQSIHMALEEQVLRMARLADKEVTKSWLLYLLQNTRSASVTAVVTSVVLAYPKDLFEVAKILFSVPDFFWCDSQKVVTEEQARSLYSIGRGLDISKKDFEDERINTCDDPHRKMSLENLALNYQFFKTEEIEEVDFDARRKEVWGILDNLAATVNTRELDEESKKKFRLLLGGMDTRKMDPKMTSQDEGKFIIEFNPDLDDDLKEFSQRGQAAFKEKHKHLSVKHWAKRKIEGGELAKDQEPYDNMPELVLKETKTILDSLENGDQDFFLINSDIPSYTCSALIRFYHEHLTEEDFSFCKDVLISYAQAPLQEHYRYQIADGVEVALNALPTLYLTDSEDNGYLNFILLLILFDTYPIGSYKRVCDYAIEALHELYKISPADANAVLYGYMMLKPKFDADDPHNRRNRERKSRAETMQAFVEKYNAEIELVYTAQIQYENVELNSQTVATFESALQIIPADTTDQNHLTYIEKLLPKFFGCFLREKGSARNNDLDDSTTDYKSNHRFFKKFAVFLLNREMPSIPEWTRPLIEEIRITSETADFLSQLVSAEDRMGKYESFWIVWEEFYPTIKSWSQTRDSRYLDEIITNYLLAWPWWKDTAKEWGSLRPKDTVFFQKVCAEMGRHPAVLYSIAKLLNEIGSKFLDDGVFWIADILSNNTVLCKDQLRPHTVFYLEKVARKFVYLNRTRLKTNRLLRSRLIILLDFLVEKGSVNGYLLREDVL